MIHILWPTIRPLEFIKMHEQWISRSSKSDIKTYVVVNTEEDLEIIKKSVTDIFIIKEQTDNIGVCYPAYKLTSNIGILFGECSEYDIIILASDDFLPPLNWDLYLINKLKNKGNVGLFVRDGYQLPDSSNMIHPAITLPIMTYGSLLMLNRYIYHPAYTHMFSDCELYDNLKDLGILYDDRLNDDTIFEHLHYAAGKRIMDDADVSYNKKWISDQITWNNRNKLNILDRIK